MAYIQSHDYGIHTIDLEFLRPGFVSSHVVADHNELALVDVGSAINADHLLAQIEALGHSAQQVKYIIVTHVHLDHAGGAGVLMQRCSNAQLVVHPRGAKHMIDPSALIAGATAVYGEEEMRRSYGDILPVPEARVIVAEDDSTLSLGKRQLRFIDTPGHAYHHLTVVDDFARAVFVGDTFGSAYPVFTVNGSAFLFPATSPTQFDPDALEKSVERILSYSPAHAYLAHFGEVDLECSDMNLFLERANAHANIAKPDFEQTYGELKAYCESELKAHGVEMDDQAFLAIMGLDLEINAKGLVYWAEKQAAG